MVNLKQLIAETFSVDASVITDDLKYQGCKKPVYDHM